MRPFVVLSAALGALLVQPASVRASACPEGVARRLPVKAAIERPFGFRLHLVMGVAVFQPSIMFRTSSGRVVKAMMGGRVTLLETKPHIGRFVWVLQRDGSELRYGPLSHTHLHIGEWVLAGGQLGRTTSSAFMLAMRRGGKWIDPKSSLGCGG